MQELIDKVINEGVHVGGGIVKLDSFLNHQVEPGLTLRMAVELCSRFQSCGVGLVTKVVTAEVSGIPVALGVASTFGADLIYARKSRSALMTGTYLCRRGNQPNPRHPHRPHGRSPFSRAG